MNYDAREVRDAYHASLWVGAVGTGALLLFLIALVVLAWAVLAPVAGAQEPSRGGGSSGSRLIEAPKPKVMEKVADRKFWLAISLLGAAKTADAISTQRMLNRGCLEIGSAWALGERPSSGRIAAAAGAQGAGEVALAYLLKRVLRRHRWLGQVWVIEPAWGVGNHTRAAWHNEGLVCR
jgi:hypothetical protein